MINFDNNDHDRECLIDYYRWAICNKASKQLLAIMPSSPILKKLSPRMQEKLRDLFCEEGVKNLVDCEEVNAILCGDYSQYRRKDKMQ